MAGDREGYSGTSIALHWIVALGVLFMLIVGYVIMFTPPAEAGPLIHLHVSVGVFVLIAAWFRVAWRLSRGFPPVTPEHKQWEIVLARISHYTLITLLVLMPLTGYLTASALEETVAIFGWFDLPRVYGHDQTVLTAFFTIHKWLAFLLTGIIVLHVAGALKAEIVNQDGTLGRMMSPHRD